MRDPVARFWAVEHVTLMLFAVVMAHVGRVLARKAKSPSGETQASLVCFVLSTIAMIARDAVAGFPAAAVRCSAYSSDFSASVFTIRQARPGPG